MQLAAFVAISVTLGIVIAWWYLWLEGLSELPAFQRALERVKPADRRFHVIYEALCIIVAAPLFVGPFVALLELPIWLNERLTISPGSFGVIGPILGLVTIAVTTRVSRARKKARAV